ncbi:hypothetical protein LEMLEM_LOCUS9748 [Lemmus lemmus]
MGKGTDSSLEQGVLGKRPRKQSLKKFQCSHFPGLERFAAFLKNMVCCVY